MTIYRITLLEWTSETNYDDTTYLDYCMKGCRPFKTLKGAIKWLDKNKHKVLELEKDVIESKEFVAIDIDIEQWNGDFINGIVYTQCLWANN